MEEMICIKYINWCMNARKTFFFHHGRQNRLKNCYTNLLSFYLSYIFITIGIWDLNEITIFQRMFGFCYIYIFYYFCKNSNIIRIWSTSYRLFITILSIFFTIVEIFQGSSLSLYIYISLIAICPNTSGISRKTNATSIWNNFIYRTHAAQEKKMTPLIG